MARAWLGVDWGTYFSKWCYRSEGKSPLVGRIWDSKVWRVEDRLALFPAERHFHEGRSSEGALKRILIDDPWQQFWDGERPRLGASLGEATVFSFFAVMIDALRTAKRRGYPMPGSGDLEVRVSHPNWMSSDNMVALGYLRDSAMIAAMRVFDWPQFSAEEGGIQLDVASLRTWISVAKRELAVLPPVPVEFDYDTYATWSHGVARAIKWRLVFESCAAGFSYLVEHEPDAFDPEDPVTPSQPRKLLVVDIGAGSTDSGYLLRTVHRQTNQPLLLWLPAAAALSRAGRWLTDRIREDWLQRGRRATDTEAEDYKTSGMEEWYGRPYVRSWCAAIADHVGDYMENVPDNDRLPRNPPLEIVVTGGSSAVKPVKPAILEAVKNALRRRGIGIAATTRLLGEVNDDPAFAIFSPIERAQLAVGLGAAHPQLAELKHYASGLRSPHLI